MKNPVAKNVRKFNKATVQKDRKRALKKGYQKHILPAREYFGGAA